MRKLNSSPSKFGNWRIDDDGMLRVTAHILKEGVYPYRADEVGGVDLAGVDPVQQYIPKSEFTDEALTSLEGKPVVINAHEWREPENTLVDGLTVGTIAGRPEVTDDGCIACDMIIYDPDTIEKIKSKNLVEVSAGYDGSLIVGDGEFGGNKYHGTQSDLRFNHVLLLPEGMGRCGYDVRIINKKSEGGNPMPVTLKITVGNKVKAYKFQNDEDAAQAEEMVEEQKSFNAEQVGAAIEAKAGLEAQIAELQAQLAEHDQHLEAAKKQIEDLLSPATQQAMAQEVADQSAAEAEIVEAETDNMDDEAEAKKEKEDFVNSLKACNGLTERRKLAVSRVMMNMRGMAVDGWTQDAFDGAFEILAANAKAHIENKKQPNRVLNGKKTKTGTVNANLDPRERMLRPMKARNAKPGIIGQ